MKFSLYSQNGVLLAVLFMASQIAFAQPNKGCIKEEKRIYMPGVKGKLDHMAFDYANKRLFLAAKTNNTVEVIDIKNPNQIRSIKGLDDPQGVVFLSSRKSVMITNGGTGSCAVFNTGNLLFEESLQFPDDADNIRYGHEKKRIYVAHGAGEIAEIDPRNLKVTKTFKFEGHPEGFQIDEQNAKMYVNIPTSKTIEVADLNSDKIIAKWQTGNYKGNYSLAIDTISERLFIAYRKPSVLEVRGLRSGKILAHVECSEDCDDIFYNSMDKELYLICGSGYIDIIKQLNADNYKTIAKIPTRQGARTGLFVPAIFKLFVALPEFAGDIAEVRVYKILAD